jgi:hypothetical protein
MSDERFEYGSTGLITQDLRRLKKWRSLEDDVKNHYKMWAGRLSDEILRSVFNYPLCEHITKKVSGGEEINFYKMRVGISNPRISSSGGCRLVFGILLRSKKFIPVLLYAACEEGKFYPINGKKICLKKSGLIQIIDEKLKLLN